MTTVRLLLAGWLLSPGLVAAQDPGDSLAFPLGLARGPGNTIVWAERNGQVVRQLNLEMGTIVTVAGTGQKGFSGDGGPATQGMLSCPDRSTDGPALERSLMGPFFLELASDSVILFTDTDANLVRQVDLRSGQLTTLAGTGERGFGGDGGAATRALFARPHVVILARNGDLIIGDSFNHRIRRVDASTGVIRTIAGSGQEGIATDGAVATESPLMYFGMIVEKDDGDLLITEWARTGRLLELDVSSGRLRVLAGSDSLASTRPGQKPLDTRFGGLAGLVVDEEGRMIVVDSDGGIKRIDLSRGTVETLVGK